MDIIERLSKECEEWYNKCIKEFPFEPILFTSFFQVSRCAMCEGNGSECCKKEPIKLFTKLVVDRQHTYPAHDCSLSKTCCKNIAMFLYVKDLTFSFALPYEFVSGLTLDKSVFCIRISKSLYPGKIIIVFVNGLYFITKKFEDVDEKDILKKKKNFRYKEFPENYPDFLKNAFASLFEPFLGVLSINPSSVS